MRTNQLIITHAPIHTRLRAYTRPSTPPHPLTYSDPDRGVYFVMYLNNLQFNVQIRYLPEIRYYNNVLYSWCSVQ